MVNLDYDRFDTTYDLVMRFNDELEKHTRKVLDITAYETLMVACEMAKVYAALHKDDVQEGD